MRFDMTESTANNNFTIKDNSSQFAKFLEDKWIEPLTIIARIKGYSGIDEYILALIEGRLNMFLETSDTIEFQEFQEYMHNTIVGKDVPNEWALSKQKLVVKKEEERKKNKEKDLEKSIDLSPKEELEKKWGKIPTTDIDTDMEQEKEDLK
jgi:hypothetical protein